MILAAVAFGDPLMLAGLAAALVPVVLHLLNRMNAPVMAFPTLRFLKITAHKTARRRQIQQYFLLLVRVIVFALLAMAVAGPLIRGGNAVLAYGMVGMLLVGVGLLLVAGVWGTAAFGGGRKKGVAGTGGRGVDLPVRREAAQRGQGGQGVLAMMAGMLAVLMLGLGAYGLASDRFFSREAGGAFSGRSTALVIVLDNSHSMLVRDEGGGAAAGTRLQRAKEEVRQLLAGGIRPAEAAIVATNPGPEGRDEVAALTSDTTRLVGMLDGVRAEGTARPMRECVRMGLSMLGNSTQPNKMLMIVSDFTRQAFADAEVFAGLKEIPWRKDLQVVLMPMGADVVAGAEGGVVVRPRMPADVGVAGFGLAEGSVRPVVGAEMTFEGQIVNNGDEAVVREVVLTVDGNEGGPGGAGAGGPAGAGVNVAVPVQRVQLGAAGSATGKTTIRMTHRLEQAGWHRYGMKIRGAGGAEGGGDAMGWDDQREVALQVAEQIKVLVVGAESGNGPRVRSAGFYFMAALAPFGPKGGAGGGAGAGEAAGGGGVPWSIEPEYRGVEQLGLGAGGAGDLGEYGAIYMCDVPRVSAGAADALARYVRGGGRVVWVLGPSVDSGAYNEILLGGNRGLLPLPLGEPLVTATAAPLDWVDMHSGVFTNLFDNQEPFRTVLVTGRWSFAGDAKEMGGAGVENAKVLAKLPEDVPVLTVHSPGGTGGAGGGGRVYTLLTSPAAAWSNLGATVVLVPLASRMALGDFAEGGGGEKVLSGEAGRAVELPVGGGGGSVDVTTPGQAVLNVKALPGAGGGAAGVKGGATWRFTRTFEEGVYRWKATEGGQEGMFVVNPPAEEVELLAADVEALGRESSPGMVSTGGAGNATVIAGSSKGLVRQLEARGEGTSLMPGFLAMVLMLAVVEAMMANRYRPAA